MQQALHYWSGTNYTGSTDDYAWEVYMNNGDVYYSLKSIHNYVWPVRDGN